MLRIVATRDQSVENPIGSRCQKLVGFKKCNLENDIVRDLSNIPLDVQLHIQNLTTIEEKLLSPVISITSVIRLSTGGNVSCGYVANFRQDSVKFVKKISTKAYQLSCLIIRRKGMEKTSADFLVCRK